MRITMIGSGYVGLVSGVCFADFGHDVICVDKDLSKIEALREGRIPIYEPGLEQLVAENTSTGRLSFSTDVGESVRSADVVFIAVGTPSRRGDGHADLSYVYAAAREIATYVEGFTVIVTKSTVPVGTGDEVERIMLEGQPIEIYGEGNMSRDFTYIDDLIEAIVRLSAVVPSEDNRLENTAVETLSRQAPFRVVNIGGGQPVSLMDFVETVEKALGHPAIRKMLAMQKGDVPRTFAAPDLLVALTGYKPDTTLDIGVKAFVDWYLDVRGELDA